MENDQNPIREIPAYQRVTDRSREEAELVMSRNQPSELLLVPISVSMYSEDLRWAETLCINLSNHPDATVRGNAILGFGHLARRFGTLNTEVIDPIVAAGLRDSEEYVRMQSSSAHDDIQHYVYGVP